MSNTLAIIVIPDDVPAVRYPGGKFRCYQKLISLIPPHRVYIETHLGGGAVMRHKRPAALNIGIDRDIRAIESFIGHPPNYLFYNVDAVDYLNKIQLSGDEFIFSDPPYPSASRRRPHIYRYEYTDEDHQRLLTLLKGLPCAVMITSYPNELYARELQKWYLTSFAGTSQTGHRTECIWTNYRPGIVHDSRFVGWTFRGRQAWRRKCQRWKERFLKLSLPEQQAMIELLAGASTTNFPEKGDQLIQTITIASSANSQFTPTSPQRAHLT